MKRTTLRQCVITSALVLAAASLWLIPSNLAYCVAAKRPILLLRYSVEWFSGLAAIALLIPGAVYLVWGRDARERRLRIFRLIAVSVSVALGLVLLDVALRLMSRSNYTREGSLYHRVPNKAYKTIEADVPGPDFAYAFSAPGYPSIAATLTTDANGFRNPAALEQADILAIGDSFTEGSQVSDEQVWPALLAGNTAQTVYNLGMSGSKPSLYLQVLREFGPRLRPKTVLVMLYEGNDFRDQNSRQSSERKSLTKRIKASPLRRIVKDRIVRGLSWHASPAAVAELPAVSWLPLALPARGDSKYYTFDLDRLKTHWLAREDFQKTKGCQSAFDVLRQLKQTCREMGARLVVVFAPDTPHVIMPPLKDGLAGGQVRAFLAMKIKPLPPEGQFLAALMERLGAMEDVMREFCLGEEIDFYSPTQALRERSMQGVQTYFTYDQHWSPEGHAIVAQGIAEFLRSPSSTPASAAAETAEASPR